MSSEPLPPGLGSHASGEFVVRPASDAPSRPTPGDRLAALAEVTLCSGFPTQLGLILVFTLLGAAQTDASGQLSLAYIVALSLADAALILTLVWLLLRAHGEQPVDVFIGTRSFKREAWLGLTLVPAAFIITAVAFGIMLQFAPSLRNVPENPLETLIQSPVAAVWFGVVAVIAGGLREEVQRAFILRRFERYLGGAVTGLVIFSVAFGLGHLMQGRDAAIVTGLLGAFWGLVYLTRRSIVAPVVCHGIFNLVEIVIAYNASVG